MTKSPIITANASSGSLRVSVLFLLKFYITLVGCFALAKVIFVLYNADCGGAFSAQEVVDAILHGLSLDIATAGYFTAPLWLGLLVGLWWRTKARSVLFKTYCAIIALLITACLVTDTGLYEFWGIKLDGTVFTYLESPEGAINSVSTAYICGAGLAYIIYTLVLYFALSLVMPREWKVGQESRVKGQEVRVKGEGLRVKGNLQKTFEKFFAGLLERTKTFLQKSLPFLNPQNAYFKKGKGLFLRTLIMLFIGGLLFLGIRGGVGKVQPTSVWCTTATTST